MSTSKSISNWLEQRHPRERALLIGMTVLLCTALLWWIAIAPALQTYRASNNAHAKLDEALAQMQTMAEEAKQLKAAPRLSNAAVQAWLDGSLKKLGKASRSNQGDRTLVQLTSTSPEALADWLAQARTAAQIVPVQVNLRRSAPSKGFSDVLWDGTLTFELPSK